MPSLVVKLGSSIVAEDSGELRLSVVARICEEVADLHRTGVDVVIVTSGAIARGRHLLEMPLRPTAIEEIQAASAGTHHLNARRTLQTLRRWRIVPVINENDTTTTDEISFGDNDFLAAQVAVLTGARLLVLLTDTDGLYTAAPRPDPTARL